jgi:hypothetical protein
MRAHKVLFVLVGWILFCSTAARADLIFYSDRPSFEAAATGLTVVDFEGIAPSPTSFAYFRTPPGLTLAGVNFNIANATPGDGLNPTGRDYYKRASYPSDFLVPSVFTRVNTDLAITLPAGFTAIALDLGSFNGGKFTVHLSTGESFTETPASFGQLSFLGFTSSDPVSSLTVSATGPEVIVLDNFTFGNAVPEPGTLALAVAGGFGLLPCSRIWRRRRRQGIMR